MIKLGLYMDIPEPNQDNRDIQTKIRDVYKNSNLSPHEKSKAVFLLLNPVPVQDPVHESPQVETKEPCPHYDRKCMILAKCCNKWFDCRLCHDEQCDHKINRFETDTIRCTECQQEQGISNQCVKCGFKFAEWYCETCRMWTNEGEIYHCKDCGFCRKGKQEDYFHCHTCNLDICKTEEATHSCQAFSTNTGCPICQESTQNATRPVIIMPHCYHSMHMDCYQKMLESGNFQCPQCKKSVLNDMSSVWNMISQAIENEPLPNELQRRISVFCNDCHETTETDFHFAGNCCQSCHGYNTC